MPRSRPRSAASIHPMSLFFGPAAMGSGYAVAKINTLRWLDPTLVLPDFQMLLLAGILLGAAIRPIIQKIYWYRSTGFVILTATLWLLGPPGGVIERLVWRSALDPMFGASQGIPHFWVWMSAETIGLITVAALANLILSPVYTRITLSMVFSRIVRLLQTNRQQAILISATVYLALFLCIRVIFQPDASIFDPVGNLTRFLSQDMLFSGGPLLFVWGRGLIITFACLPLLSILRGNRYVIVLVIGALFFIINDFIPLFANSTAVPPYLMLEHVFEGLFLDFIFCYILVRLFEDNLLNSAMDQQQVPPPRGPLNDSGDPNIECFNNPNDPAKSSRNVATVPLKI